MVQFVKGSHIKPLPDEWTKNVGENERDLCVGMDVRLSDGTVSPVLAVSPGGVTIMERSREVTIGDKTFAAQSRVVRISARAEVEYRKSTMDYSNEEKRAMANGEKNAKSKNAPRPARKTTDGPTVLGHGISPFIVYLGAVQLNTDEAVAVLEGLRFDLGTIKSSSGPRKYINDRLWYGRNGKMTPADITDEQRAKIQTVVEKYRASEQDRITKAEAEKAKAKAEKTEAKAKAKAAKTEAKAAKTEAKAAKTEAKAKAAKPGAKKSAKPSAKKSAKPSAKATATANQ